MNFQVGQRLRRFLRAAFWITQRRQLLRSAKFIQVVAVSSPSQTAQNHGTMMRQRKVFVQVTRNADKRPVRTAAALGRFFVNPHLGLNVIDVRFVPFRRLPTFQHIRRITRGQHASVRQHVHVIVNFIVELVVRRARGNRVSTINSLRLNVIQVHWTFAPLRAVRHPRAADNRFPPRRIFERNGGRVEHHQTAAALDEVIDHDFLLRSGIAPFLSVSDDDIDVLDLLRGRPVHGSRRLGAAFIQQHLPFLEETRVGVDFGPPIAHAPPDKDSQWLGRHGLYSEDSSR